MAKHNYWKKNLICWRQQRCNSENKMTLDSCRLNFHRNTVKHQIAATVYHKMSWKLLLKGGNRQGYVLHCNCKMASEWVKYPSRGWRYPKNLRVAAQISKKGEWRWLSCKLNAAKQLWPTDTGASLRIRFYFYTYTLSFGCDFNNFGHLVVNDVTKDCIFHMSLVHHYFHYPRPKIRQPRASRRMVTIPLQKGSSRSWDFFWFQFDIYFNRNLFSHCN